MMPGSLKVLDLRRDPRLALHCPTEDTPPDEPGSWLGDAKVTGCATEVCDRSRVDEAHRFSVDILEVVQFCLGTPWAHLVFEFCLPDGGMRSIKRR